VAAATKGPWSLLQKSLFAALFAVVIVGVICRVWLIERTVATYEPEAPQERAEVVS
jgi:hypothetical protein